MKFYLSLLFLLMLSLLSCTGMKDTSANNEENTNTEEVRKEEKREQEILAAGYSKCEVVDMGSQDECGFVLQDLNAKKLYKPVQWEGEFAMYQQNGNIVYIKYRASKITQTVCLQSMPIILDEMKLVE